MGLRRVFEAIQRSTHLTRKEIAKTYPELNQLLQREISTDQQLEIRLSALSFLSVRRGTGCWVNSYYQELYGTAQADRPRRG